MRYFATQSSCEASVMGSVSSPWSTVSQWPTISAPKSSPPTHSYPNSSPYFFARSNSSHCTSSAVTVEPSDNSIGRRNDRSYDTRRNVCTGATNTNSRGRNSSSTIDSTSAVVPSFNSVATSERLASPTITCSRRYFCASACGSSRVFTIGRLSVVSSPTSSSKKSARCVSWNGTSSLGTPLASEPTLPAPQ